MSVSSTTVTVTLGDSEVPVELSTDAQGEFTTSSDPTSGSTLPQRSIVPPSAPPPSPPTSNGSRGEMTEGQPSHPLTSSTTWEGQCVEGPSPRESPPSLPEVPLPNGPSGSTREGQMESRSSSPRERRKGPVQSPPPFPGVPLPAPSSSTSITSSATSITSNTDMQVH